LDLDPELFDFSVTLNPIRRFGHSVPGIHSYLQTVEILSAGDTSSIRLRRGIRYKLAFIRGSSRVRQIGLSGHRVIGDLKVAFGSRLSAFGQEAFWCSIQKPTTVAGRTSTANR